MVARSGGGRPAARGAPGRPARGRACSCSGRSSPSVCGPTSPARWARRWPTAPARSSGRARVAMPVACFAFGVVLLWPRRARRRRRRRRDDPTPTPTSRPPRRPTVRIAIGALLLFVADVGILHLAYGRPPLGGDLDDLRNAGGALGAHGRRPARRRHRRGRCVASCFGAVAFAGVLLVARSLDRRDRRRHGPRLAPRPPRRAARCSSRRIGEGVDTRRAAGAHRARHRSSYAQYEDAEPKPRPSRRHRTRAGARARPDRTVAIEIPRRRRPERSARHRPRRRRARAAPGSVEAAAGQRAEAGERQGGRPPPRSTRAAASSRPRSRSTAWTPGSSA